jgi:hypothetical protein
MIALDVIQLQYLAGHPPSQLSVVLRLGCTLWLDCLGELFQPSHIAFLSRRGQALADAPPLLCLLRHFNLHTEAQERGIKELN